MVCVIIFLTVFAIILSDSTIFSEISKEDIANKSVHGNCSVKDGCVFNIGSDPNSTTTNLEFPSSASQDTSDPRGSSNENVPYDKPLTSYGISHRVGLPNYSSLYNRWKKNHAGTRDRAGPPGSIDNHPYDKPFPSHGISHPVGLPNTLSLHIEGRNPAQLQDRLAPRGPSIHKYPYEKPLTRHKITHWLPNYSPLDVTEEINPIQPQDILAPRGPSLHKYPYEKPLTRHKIVHPHWFPNYSPLDVTEEINPIQPQDNRASRDPSVDNNTYSKLQFKNVIPNSIGHPVSTEARLSQRNTRQITGNRSVSREITSESNPYKKRLLRYVVLEPPRICDSKRYYRNSHGDCVRKICPRFARLLIDGTCEPRHFVRG